MAPKKNQKNALQKNTLKMSAQKYSKILKNEPVLAWEREARLNWKSWKYAAIHVPSTIHTSCLHVPCMSHVLCQRCSCSFSSGFLMVSLLFSSSFFCRCFNCFCNLSNRFPALLRRFSVPFPYLFLWPLYDFPKDFLRCSWCFA